LAGYYEFTTAGQLSFYNLVGTVATLSGSYNYTLTNSGTVLHLTVGTTSTDSAIAFPDNNTLNITSTTIATVSYTVNGVLSYGDKQVDISTLIRL
jgi:VCBS repeat-containing protein